MTEIIVNLKTNQTLLIILDPIRLQNGPRLIADLSFYATVPFFDSSRRWQFHEKKNTKIPWKPWDIPDLFEFMADDISTNGPRRINSYVKNNPYLKIFMTTALFIWWYKNKIRNIKTLISGDKKAECDPHKLVYKKEEDRNHVC